MKAKKYIRTDRVSGEESEVDEAYVRRIAALNYRDVELAMETVESGKPIASPLAYYEVRTEEVREAK